MKVAIRLAQQLDVTKIVTMTGRNRPFADATERAWTFRTVAKGHGEEFWRPFLEALTHVGYDDVLSNENEDPLEPAVGGVANAARFIHLLLPTTSSN